MMSNAMAESVGKAVFHNVITASLPLADLGFTAGAVTSLSIALHSAIPGIGNLQTSNEVSTATWTTYARQLVSRTSGNWPFTSPNIFENGVTIAFPQNGAGGSATSISWASIGSNVSNRIIFQVPLALELPKPFSLLSAAGDTVQCEAHGYAAGQEVMFLDTEGGALPTGITEGQVYVVRNSPNTNDFTVATVANGSGGAAVDLGSVGSGNSSGGWVCKVSSKSVGANDTFQFDTSNKLTVALR